jgi:hypothetical protein
MGFEADDLAGAIAELIFVSRVSLLLAPRGLRLDRRLERRQPNGTAA